MLGLPPETVYHHVREGVITVAGLGLVLVVAVAWRMGHLATLAPMLFSGALLAMLTPTVLVVRRRYRHVLAAMLVLAVLLGLLVAAVHRYGYPSTLAFVVGPTPSAIADAVSPR
jgi:predicted PurR-regulated permease PerM